MPSIQAFLPHRGAAARLARAWPTLRRLPFLVGSAGSIAASFLAPEGRKPFHIDWDVSLESLHFSITKGPHIGAAMMVGLAAVVALGRHRLWLAFLLSVLVGWGWEMGQTTVIGHSARLADLAPDAVGSWIGCAWGACVLWLAEQPFRPALPARNASAPAETHQPA